MKRLTRRQVRFWFQPVTDFLDQALLGEVEAVQGYPIIYIATRRTYAPAHVGLVGMRETIERFVKDVDLSLFDKIAAKLESGVFLTEDDVLGLKRLLQHLEDKIIRIPRDVIYEGYRTQEIALKMRNL